MRLVIAGETKGLPGLDPGVTENGWWTIQGCKGPGNFGIVDHGRWAEEITVAILFLLREINSDLAGPPLEIEDVNDETLDWTINWGNIKIKITGEEIQAEQHLNGKGSPEGRRDLQGTLREIITRKMSVSKLH